jgi:hypothetical protein
MNTTGLAFIDDMMIFLLKFFLARGFITHDLILQWYNGNNAHGYMGFEEAKRLAEPFITSYNNVF